MGIQSSIFNFQKHQNSLAGFAVFFCLREKKVSVLKNPKKIVIFALVKSIEMKRQRIYIDTSIVGGFFDKIFEEETKLLFQQLEGKKITFVISEVLTGELEKAPEKVRTLLDKYDSDYLEKVPLTDEARELADKYVAENVVGKTSYDDCCHIALATIHRVDVLASWNFKHIVNLVRIRGYNGVNLKNGYATIEIRNPRELIDYGKDI